MAPSEGVSPPTEKHEFKAEVNALLRLVTGSLYTHKEIFVRELVSNAADALDKARFQAVVQPEIIGTDDPPRITIVADRSRSVLVIEDNGIGMSRSEIAENLGTIAHSGTLAFLERVRAAQDVGQRPDVNLIGQFGVGFYSAFMVADRIDVYSRSAQPAEAAVHWSSTGDGTFDLGSADRAVRGTRIELHLAADQKEFLERHRIESIVRRYSNYVMYPIRFQVIKDDGTSEAEPAQINQASAFWTRPTRELTEHDYGEFYKQVMGGFVLPGDEPLTHLHLSSEAPLQFHALLYVPGRAPMDLFMDDRRGVQLYVRRVLVMDNCDKLLPPYLRFVRGVVDSEDLPLNVSREMLQEHKVLSAIRRQLTRKMLAMLDDIAKHDTKRYEKIWNEFGVIVKEGIHTDNSHRGELTDLLRWRSSTRGAELVSLAEYVDAMPADQNAIYYIVGQSVDALAKSPHLETCKARGFSVLLMTDPVDEWVVQELQSYRDKPLRSVTQGQLDIETSSAESPPPDEAVSTIARAVAKANEILAGRVKSVRPSRRLTESASCLVDDEGALSRNMERILRLANQSVPSHPRILELNPAHPFVRRLDALCSERQDDPRLTTWIELLYDQAALAEGTVPDPVGTVRRIQSVLDELANA